MSGILLAWKLPALKLDLESAFTIIGDICVSVCPGRAKGRGSANALVVSGRRQYLGAKLRSVFMNSMISSSDFFSSMYIL